MNESLAPDFSLNEHVDNQNSLQEKNQDLIWVSVSEAAKLGGVQDKTIRRAIKANALKFKIVKNRYQISLHSLLVYLHQTTKLKNKLNQLGVGKYVEKWKL